MKTWKTILSFEDEPDRHRLYTMEEFVELADPGQTWLERSYGEETRFEVTEINESRTRILIRFPQEDEFFEFIIVKGMPIDRISYEFIG